MTIQWMLAARGIGKRLLTLKNESNSNALKAPDYEIVCGVAGCVLKKKAPFKV